MSSQDSDDPRARVDARDWLQEVGHLAARDAVRALKLSLETMDAAGRVLEAVVERLGERAWQELEFERHRRLGQRDADDPRFCVPQALVEQIAVDRIPERSLGIIQIGEPIVPIDAPAGWKHGDPHWNPLPRADIVPTGPSMFAGRFALRCGASSLAFDYGADGRRGNMQCDFGDFYAFVRFGGVRPFLVDPDDRPPTPRPFALLCRADLDVRGHDVATLARMICELDQAREVAVRVHCPVPLPDGVDGAWRRALPGLREVLWSGRVPDAARWLVADGFEGRAVGFGETRDEALAMLRRSIWAEKPTPFRDVDPPAPPAPAGPAAASEPVPRIGKEPEGIRRVPLGRFEISFAPLPSNHEWPTPTPDNTPLVMLPLASRRRELPVAFARAGYAWRPTLDAFGGVHLVLVREDERGGTIVGDGVVDLVDPDTLDAELDPIDERERTLIEDLNPGWQTAWSDPARAIRFSVWDAVGRRRKLDYKGELHRAPGAIDPADVRWGVARWRTPSPG